MCSPGGRDRGVEVELVHELVVLSTGDEAPALGVLERLAQQVSAEVGLMALADRLRRRHDRQPLVVGYVARGEVVVV